jgi:hypothetical protein
LSDLNNIPEDLIPYLDEIAMRLWTNHATVMIGAGFSRNNKCLSDVQKNYPTWDELGDVFYYKLYKEKPVNKNFLNVLKLADEVQAAFGRSVLDHLIKTEIPDNEFEPSFLHETLLKLPWIDVFTTNYDTLLERAANNVSNRRYDIVINKEDLVYSAKPRIIKLHGSFPSERPFIITEEDYRCYPKEYAPFVNTVQQSLLENTLCLLGFSGNDPNFLQWIGWIRDNLGKENSPKIFLIGKLDLTIAQKRLLEKRNITTLDFGSLNSNISHADSISLFLEYLIIAGKKKYNLEWGYKYNRPNIVLNETSKDKINDLLNNLKTNRESYPNWVVLDQETREYLVKLISNYEDLILNIPKINIHDDIQLLYEYNWIIEKCLYPIPNNLIVTYQYVLEKYDPIPKTKEIENVVEDPSKEINIDCKYSIHYWIELSLSLLRYYREENFTKEWIDLNNNLNSTKTCLCQEQYAKLCYERTLFQLFKFNIEKLRNELKDWQINDSLPYWNAKKAGIYAEIGDIEIAKEILDKSLFIIRNKLNLTPIFNDYKLVSEEAYVMLLLHYINYSFSISNGFSDQEENKLNEFNEKWNYLKQFKCDPWGELKIFKLTLENYIDGIQKITNKPGFEIGSYSRKFKIELNLNLLRAYSYLRFHEEIGLPMHLPNIILKEKCSQNAIKYLAKNSSNWAYVTLLRTNDDNLINEIFDRNTIFFLDNERIDQMIIDYMNVLSIIKDEIKNGDHFINRNLGIAVSTTLPEIISRLSIKCNYDIKIKLIELSKDIYLSDYKLKYKGISKLLKRVIKSMTFVEQFHLIPKLLEFPILTDLDELSEDEFIDPILFIDLEPNKINNYKALIISESVIFELLNISAPNNIKRIKALRRLIKLWELRLLNRKQTSRLAELIWAVRDETNGYPFITDYDYFDYFKLPHPKNIKLSDLFNNFLLKAKFPINEDKDSISFSSIPIKITSELIGSINYDINFKLEPSILNQIIEKSVVWWDSDKRFLYNKNELFFLGNVSEEFKIKFKKLMIVFADVYAPNIHQIEPINLTSIKRVLFEFKDFSIPNLSAIASFYYLIPEAKEYYEKNIIKALYSNNKDVNADSLKSLKYLLDQPNDILSKLILLVSEQVKCRCKTNLYLHLDVLTNIIENKTALITKEILSNLEIGLEFLIDEINILPEDKSEVVSDKLIIKKLVAIISISLYKYYNNKNLEIPTYINKWKQICLDKNEFPEIRNVWLNANI